ncbi:MAG TPA: ABC transporter permease, partial [Holophagaceae bacterium]
LRMLKMIWRQFVMEWKLYTRDKGAMFWTFAFPIVALLGFGVIFRGGGPKVGVVWVEPSQPTPRDAAFLKAMAEVQLAVKPLPPAEAAARWARSEIAAEVVPSGTSYRIRLNSYLLAQGGPAAGLVNQAWLVAQARLNGSPEPERLPVSTESPGGRKAANYAAFLLPGLLGLNLLSIGLFSVGMVNVSYREKGKFRRLAVTPLPKWVFLMGQVLQRLVISLLSAALLITVGWLAFGIRNQGSYLAVLLVLTLGTACFMSIGFALSGFAETIESYAPLANLFFFPLMFLNGVFFTLDSAPRWLQHVAGLMPLAPFLSTLRGVFNDGASLNGHWAALGLVFLWTSAAFFLAVRRFRWT